MATLLAQDVRLATVAERLMQANAGLCRRTMPLLGVIFHSRDQYPSGDVAAAFASGPIAVAATVPGSPAAEQLQAGDGLLAIGSRPTADLRREGEAPLRDSAFAALAELPADQPLAITLRRADAERLVSLTPAIGCRALAEIRAADTHNARTDGRVVQVTYGLAQDADDQQLAVIFAHELAHVVLEHRRKLEAAGVSKGFLGEFGKNQRLNRTVEVEADRLSVHLLANGGYDPSIAPAFWRSGLGRRAGSGLMLSATYPNAEARAQLLEREIAEYLGNGAGPSWPGHLLARRDTPFS